MIRMAPLSMALLLGSQVDSRPLAMTMEDAHGNRLPRRFSQIDLLKGLVDKKPKGELKATVTGLATDSRRVVPGSLFFAISGYRTDGNDYIGEAISRGAIGIVSERPHPRICPVPFWTVGDARTALADVAARFYGHPENDLKIAAVTGTNGKTTVAMLTQHLMEGDDPVGLLSTVRYDVGKRTFPAFRTTPESVDIYALLDQMRTGGCSSMMMEASSHGIHQKRVWGVQLEVAVFTNLTQDHLDYHGDLNDYFETKAKLFAGVGAAAPRVGVINISDAHGAELARRLAGRMKLVTFGKENVATHQIVIKSMRADGVSFDLVSSEDTLSIESALPGEYNIYNLAAAILCAQEMGVTREAILDRLASFRGIPGRMQRVEHFDGVHVFVDYAHTHDAIHNALNMLGEVIDGQIHIVFGCGGDRDRSKRPKMMQAALDGADRVYLTADNPRLEALDQIFGDTMAAVEESDRMRVQVIRDRREAIAVALRSAKPEDCVLIAGKGHENFQEIADALIPFDDVQTAQELIAALELKGGVHA